MKLYKKILLFSLISIITLSQPLSIFATSENEIETDTSLGVQSDEIENWPQGPVIGAQSACLMDVETGAILYQKDMDKKQYPASTTKLLTCLIAAETCSMNEIVTFSKNAVFSIEQGSSNVGMDVGQSITMEQALYCIMLASANEVATAVAEHISGNVGDFAILMNQKAKELGCTNSHFVNANGLHNDDHYTSAHDLALITSAYFKNELLQKIASTTYYEMHATSTQPDDFAISNHHKMLKGQKYYYENVIGGKTGYTDIARQTLATCAEKDGMKLVCTVMRDESPYQFTDTKDLFEYGFNNFKKWNVAENETRYSIDSANFFQTDNDIFGDSKTVFSINSTDYILLPNTAVFSEAKSDITYDDNDPNTLAQISYQYNGNYVGFAHINIDHSSVPAFEFGQNNTETVSDSNSVSANANFNKDVVFVSVRPILIIVGSLIGLLFIIFFLQALIKNYSITKRRKKNIKKKNRRYYSEYDDFDF